MTSFRAQELHSDGSFHTTSFRIAGSRSRGFVLERQGNRLAAVEINASHTAIGSPAAGDCPLCAGGLPTHCPDRLVLGIDRLPGGFGPWVLAPAGNIVPVLGAGRLGLLITAALGAVRNS